MICFPPRTRKFLASRGPMGASAGAIGRFNVVKGAEKREPAFGAKCGQRDLFGRLRLVSSVAAGLCFVV